MMCLNYVILIRYSFKLYILANWTAKKKTGKNKEQLYIPPVSLLSDYFHNVFLSKSKDGSIEACKGNIFLFSYFTFMGGFFVEYLKLEGTHKDRQVLLNYCMLWAVSYKFLCYRNADYS